MFYEELSSGLPNGLMHHGKYTNNVTKSRTVQSDLMCMITTLGQWQFPYFWNKRSLSNAFKKGIPNRKLEFDEVDINEWELWMNYFQIQLSKYSINFIHVISCTY